MKKFILSLAAMILIAMYGYSTIWTVSNNPDSPGQFTDIQAAIDSANEGDTIYVSGSPNYYDESDTITKQLVLIGSGYHPGNQWGYPTFTSNFILEREFDENDNIISSPDGTEFIGFDVYSIRISMVNFSLSYGIDNIKISRCRVRNAIIINGFVDDHAVGWTIKNCIIQQIIGHYYAAATVIRNNIFLETVSYAESIYDFDGSTLIANNIFCGTDRLAFDNVKNCQMVNNIFYGQQTAGADYCTFSNNISFSSGFMYFLYDHNSGANNQVNVDPQFVDVSTTIFDYGYDYHLLTGSPGIGGGTNGTDVGIYGGAYPMPSGGDNPFETSPMPPIPQVIEMNLHNADVPVNGTLQVQVKARKQD